MEIGNLSLMELLRALGVSSAFATLGVLVFIVAFWLMAKMLPFPVLKEIEQDQNVALAILMGSVIIGLAVIISSAVG
jgi:uncharacterized membrane protein YjfL (UPF0719 family)